jgi:pimeloyl-ACP methyl ester carboxylesterase
MIRLIHFFCVAGILISVNVARGERDTTLPVISPLELQLVFPGSQSQGQNSSRVQPTVGCELVQLRAADGTKIVSLFGKGIASREQPASFTLLFFYGNGMCMADCLSVFNQFRNLGFNVITADYEGYGMSGGTASEPGCYAAADAAYDYLLTRKDVDPNRLVATGWSLGAAVAIDLASRLAFRLTSHSTVDSTIFQKSARSPAQS